MTGERSEDKPEGGSVWKDRAATGVLALVTLTALAIDLVTKWLAFRFLAGAPVSISRERVLAAGEDLHRLIPDHEPTVIVPSVLELTLVLNRGAVFGMGAGRRWFFVIFTVLAIGFGLWIFGAWTRARDRLAHVGIGLLLAGGLGNLYDRLLYACVRDFLHPLPGVTWPFGWETPLVGGREVWPYVSNLADLWLIIGMGLLIVHLWRGHKHEG